MTQRRAIGRRKATGSRVPHRACAAGAALVALAAFGLPAAGADRFDHPVDPSFVVLDFARIPGELAEPEPAPRLRIFGDGLVLVERPRGMAGAGTWELRLVRSELRELLARLEATGVLGFDDVEVRAEVARAEERRRAGGELFAVSDPTRTELTIRLSLWAPADGLPLRDFAQRLTWNDARPLARRHPGVEALGGMVRAEEILLQLAASEELVRIGPPGLAADRAGGPSGQEP